MRSSPRKRSKYIIATGVVSTLLLMACAEAPTSPSANPALRADRGPSSNSGSSSGSNSGSSGSGSGQVETVQLVFNPAWTRGFKLPDGHVIIFPANSVCEIGTSGYGPETWDLPCTPETRTVAIVATVRTDENGHPAVDFTPRMRFNPDAGAVTLTLKDSFESATDRAILYCPDDASECVDESLTDPSLVTYSLAGGNFYRRRIKHFSGYNIASGRSISTSMME